MLRSGNGRLVARLTSSRRAVKPVSLVQFQATTASRFNTLLSQQRSQSTWQDGVRSVLPSALTDKFLVPPEPQATVPDRSNLPGAVVKIGAISADSVSTFRVNHFHAFYDGLYIKEGDRYHRADKANRSIEIADDKVRFFCGPQIFLDVERDGRVEEWSHLTLPKYAGQVMPNYVALRTSADGELDMFAADSPEDAEGNPLAAVDADNAEEKWKPSLMWLWSIAFLWVVNQAAPGEKTDKWH